MDEKNQNSEPWRSIHTPDGITPFKIVDQNEGIVGDAFDESQAARIVACVNGCRGMNPAAVPELVKACQEWAGAWSVMSGMYDRLLPGWRQAYAFGEILNDTEKALAMAKIEQPIVIDLGTIPLPLFDDLTAAEMVQNEIEAHHPEVQVGAREYLFKVGARRFTLASGAGFAVVEIAPEADGVRHA